MPLTLLKRGGSPTPLTAVQHDANMAAIEAEMNAKAASTDPRLSDARTPTAHNQAIETITGLADALAGKASTTALAALGEELDAKAGADDARLTNRRLPVFSTNDRAPLVTDDAASGFAVGHLWIWPDVQRAWISVVDTTGAALWLPTSLTGEQAEVLASIDGGENPVMRLLDALPPYDPGSLSGASTDLENDHNLGTFNLMHETMPTVIIRAQANYEWDDKVIFMFGRRAGPFRISIEEEVSLGGELAGEGGAAWDVPGGFSRAAIWRSAEDDWDAAGNLTPVE